MSRGPATGWSPAHQDSFGADVGILDETVDWAPRFVFVGHLADALWVFVGNYVRFHHHGTDAGNDSADSGSTAQVNRERGAEIGAFEAEFRSSAAGPGGAELQAQGAAATPCNGKEPGSLPPSAEGSSTVTVPASPKSAVASRRPHFAAETDFPRTIGLAESTESTAFVIVCPPKVWSVCSTLAQSFALTIIVYGQRANTILCKRLRDSLLSVILYLNTVAMQGEYGG